MENRITQRDIAKLLKVNQSTVSLALKGDTSIGADTRKKVLDCSERLSYRPDSASRELANRRWSNRQEPTGEAIAYLVDRSLEDPTLHKRFLAGAELRAKQRGYIFHVFDLGEYKSLEVATRVLHSRGIRGLIVPQPSFPEPSKLLNKGFRNFTVISLDIATTAVPFHIVGPDTLQATRLVWNEVVRRGYQRIGGALLSHSPRAYDDSTRLGASLSSQREWVRKSQRLPLLETHHSDRDSFYRWLDSHKPDVVIGFIARVYDWLVDSGRRVPEDIAFAALGIVLDETPQISGTPLPDHQIGVAGIDSLISAMQADEWGVPTQQRKLLLEPIWHEGKSLPSLLTTSD